MTDVGILDKADQDTAGQLGDINAAIAASAAGMTFGWFPCVRVVLRRESASYQ